MLHSRDSTRQDPTGPMASRRWRRRTSALAESARRDIASIRQRRACEFAQEEAPAADGPTLMLCQRLGAPASTDISLPRWTSRSHGALPLLPRGAVALRASRAAAASVRGCRMFDRLREPIRALPQVAYKARPALACIIGARRAWTVEMISSDEMPCR